MVFVPLASRDDPSPSFHNISSHLAPLWPIYTSFIDHDRGGSREHIYAVGIITGIGGKEYGLESEICIFCKAYDCESRALSRQIFNIKDLVVVFFSILINTNMFPFPMNNLYLIRVIHCFYP